MRGFFVVAFSAGCVSIFASAKGLEAGSLENVAESKWRRPARSDDADVEAPPRSLRVSGGVTKYTGGSSFMDSLKGMLIGCVLLPFSFALLLVNEQNHARMASLIGRAKASVKETSSAELDHQLDWELVSTSGTTTTSSSISDPDFVDNNAATPKPLVNNSVKLNRQLEIYQNVEKSKKSGEGSNETTTYWVEQEWCASYVDSENFQPENQSPRAASNPPLPAFAMDGGFDKTWYADTLEMGAFKIPQALMEKVDNWKDMGDWCYLQGRKESPQVGDARIKWRNCPCGPTSIVAIQDDGGSFLPYRLISRLCVWSKSAENEALRAAANLSDDDYEATLACPIPLICCLCNMATRLLHMVGKVEVYYIKAGVQQSAAESMSEIESREGMMAVCCRFVGWLLMFGSIMMIANPLVKALQFIPFVGPFLASVLHIAIFLVALVMTASLSAVIIAIAYVLVRPLLTITLTAIVFGVFVLGSKLLPTPDNPEAGDLNMTMSKMIDFTDPITYPKFKLI